MTETTYNLLEEVVQTQLRRTKSFDTETKEGKDALAKSVQLTELLITADKDNADYYDKEERRRIEEERNKAATEVEKEKQKLTWGRVGFEMGKVLLPLAAQIAAFGVLQKRMFKFEETGRINSTGGREMHLPRFWK